MMLPKWIGAPSRSCRSFARVIGMISRFELIAALERSLSLTEKSAEEKSAEKAS